MDRTTYCRWVRPCLTLDFQINVLVLVSAGQEEVVKELVGAGADVNRKNDKGITPLFVARVPSVSVPYAALRVA